MSENKAVLKTRYYKLIVLILANLKNPENYKKIYSYSQDLLMKELEEKEVAAKEVC